MVLQKSPKKNLKRSLPSVSLSLMGCGDEVTSQFDHWQKTPLPFIYDERLKWWDCISDKSVMDSSESSETLPQQTGHACASLMVRWGNDHQQLRKRPKRNVVSPDFGPVVGTHISQELLQPLCLSSSTDEGKVQSLVSNSQPATSALEDFCRYEEEDESKSASSYSRISPTAFYIMDDPAETTPPQSIIGFPNETEKICVSSRPSYAGTSRIFDEKSCKRISTKPALQHITTGMANF